MDPVRNKVEKDHTQSSFLLWQHFFVRIHRRCLHVQTSSHQPCTFGLDSWTPPDGIVPLRSQLQPQNMLYNLVISRILVCNTLLMMSSIQTIYLPTAHGDEVGDCLAQRVTSMGYFTASHHFCWAVKILTVCFRLIPMSYVNYWLLLNALLECSKYYFENH